MSNLKRNALIIIGSLLVVSLIGIGMAIGKEVWGCDPPPDVYYDSLDIKNAPLDSEATARMRIFDSLRFTEPDTINTNETVKKHRDRLRYDPDVDTLRAILYRSE